jgi:periplasmic protein TonB
MKTLLLAACVLLVQATCYSQEVRKKRTENEIFYVLKSDGSVRHGEYIKKYQNKITVKGQYEMNKKSGIWEYYGLDSKIEQKYDYTYNALLFNDTNRPTTIQCVVVENGVPTRNQPTREPILIGGHSSYIRHIFQNLKYPPYARTNGIEGQVFVSATVTSQGVMKDVKLLQGIGAVCDEEALRVMEAFESEWIPGEYNGEKVDVMVVFPIGFRLG